MPQLLRTRLLVMPHGKKLNFIHTMERIKSSEVLDLCFHLVFGVNRTEVLEHLLEDNVLT